uniref:Uncharacterized protein n=1 Tax=Candidatus Methanogaster sp. ANME-2c ERB4 TaxID=2759911 RepID=A0A7G9YQQ3_9EURY|nr:hypothetical protein INKIAHDB_00002 [Methanosarcinales archaeon ANME-2c ERB4]
MEIYISEYRAQNPTLWGAHFRLKVFSFLHYARFKETTDQLQQRWVYDPLLQTFHQSLVIHCVKELRDVHIHHKVDRTGHDSFVELLQSIVTAPIGSKPVGRVYKILLKDRFENLLDCHLDDLVLDSRDSERSFLAVWRRD